LFVESSKGAPADQIKLAFAAVVAGLTGEYLHNTRSQSTWDRKRFIYTEVVAGLSILLALLWLLPFTGSFIHWPVDFILFVSWIVAFGLLVDVSHCPQTSSAFSSTAANLKEQFIGPLNCGSVFNWGDLTQKGTCQKWKADVAFIFLSAIFWLASALVGLWFIHRHRRTNRAVAGDGIVGGARRRWYRRH